MLDKKKLLLKPNDTPFNTSAMQGILLELPCAYEHLQDEISNLQTTVWQEQVSIYRIV